MKSTALGITKVAGWFIATLLAFDVGCWFVFNQTPLKNTHLRAYFWYGQAYEGKLRDLVNTPNLSPRSVLYAGWINPKSWEGRPTNADLTLYGSSFANNLMEPLKTLRPELQLRFIGGPGAPMNHTYGAYELDRTMRKTKVALIGIVSQNVAQVLTMNVGSVYGDAAMPYFFPRYDLVNGRIERSATPVLNSETELKQALAEPALWERQLDVMAKHDDAYERFLFASDFLDSSLLTRLVRRGLAKSHEDRYVNAAHDRAGFKTETYQVQVFRALVERMIADLRSEGVKPIVVLFATRDYGDHLNALLKDTLVKNNVPYINSFDVCPSTRRESFVPDGHLTPACSLEIAKRTLRLFDEALLGVPT